jgi:hypothetical protein
VRVLRTPDRRWRAELRPDGWRLTLDGFPVLTAATLDQVVAYMLDAGADPRELVED